MVYSVPPAAPAPEPEVTLPVARAVIEVEGKRLPLDSDPSVLGRSDGCEIVLSDPNVSRRHAELRMQGGEWHVVDLGSTNGVKVNGRVVSSARLRDGDRITLGTSTAVFRLEG